MGTNINFKQDSILHAEKYYQTLHLAADQANIIKSMGTLISQYLPLSERAIKGFIWRVLKDWQVNQHKDLSEVLKLSPAERVKVVIGLFDMLKEALTRILISQEQAPLLDDAFKNAINFYKEHFANR